ncbi:hypothetical protein [Ruania rhizosphaerae]|uniref:hypothetical protein n=1 Tax=Ruania rhizosphaerae TaxID=1840413 RepID=UPI00135B9756|nr:hypothetical protein [Ruania rhizosphaerae]
MDSGFSFVPILTWVLIPAFVIGVIAFSRHQAKKRREHLARWAAARGWRYTPSAPHLVSRWRSEPFGRGSSRRATNVLSGDFHGRHVVSMTYKYTTGSGKNRSTHTFHVIAMHLPAPLPWLQLSPEGMGDSIAKFFGGQDIEFESEAFNDAWRVKAPPGQYAYDVIHPRMMERLMQPDALRRTISIEGQDILMNVSGRQQEQYIDAYANLLYGIVDQVPRHVWLRAGYDPGMA